ncbi:molybdenum cofactor biosynthesis protein MoaE [Salininema proteolyticum]|uniref:Molybdenum cofactor biosynthesis protein MoaE n=1 Tax=Salininema proteolyticum TaxID=1607685 RepID=A0ABV8U5A8_9ACTN
MIHVEMTEHPIEASLLEQKCAPATSGARVSFHGVVRDHDHGKTVLSLTYEAHPSAEGVLDEVAREVKERHGLDAVALSHRVGDLSIGEAALVAVVASPHRGESFRAIAEAVDLVKERLPVWKHQYFSDGTDEWVNCA